MWASHKHDAAILQPLCLSNTRGASNRLEVGIPTEDSYIILRSVNVSFTNYGGTDLDSAHTGRFVLPLQRSRINAPSRINIDTISQSQLLRDGQQMHVHTASLRTDRPINRLNALLNSSLVYQFSAYPGRLTGKLSAFCHPLYCSWKLQWDKRKLIAISQQHFASV
jgi:hypothetical protein